MLKRLEWLHCSLCLNCVEFWFMRRVAYFICGLALHWASVLHAAECSGNPDAIGTNRTIVVDPIEHPRIGVMNYPESLPLEDHEIVLTFDDGPIPPYTNRVLEILDSECVKATFFLVGQMARTHPEVVQKIHEAGHTIGTHSQNHPLHRMSTHAAQQIDDGIDSVTWALGGESPAPFFRVPGLLRSDAIEHYAAARHLMIWSADFLADDWHRISSEQVYERALRHIEANHRGILLLHDIHERTVEALPNILQELKIRGYHIVHVVPTMSDLPKTATTEQQWIRDVRRISPQLPIYPEPEVEPASRSAEAPVSRPPTEGDPPVASSICRGCSSESPRVLGSDEAPTQKAARPMPSDEKSDLSQLVTLTPRPKQEPFDAVPDVNIPREDKVPIRSTPKPVLSGPNTLITMPHGAFP